MVASVRGVVWLALMGSALNVGGVSAGAQNAAAGGPPEVIANGGLIHTLLAAPVTGQPYSAVQIARMVQTLADGTQIRRSGQGHGVARDSAGRVRVERRMSNGANGKPAIMSVFVLDPVARAMTVWSTGGPGERTAAVIKLPAEKGSKPMTENAAPKGESGRPQPIITTENLGTETIENLPVEVVKTTTIVPAGRSGNDAPITKTHETWTSQDLKLTMKEQWEDPRTGERTVELMKFSRAEPDPALFRAPAEYTVKDLKQTMQELQQKLEQLQQ